MSLDRPLRLSPGRMVVWLMVGSAVARVLFAASTGLGIDESYMVAAGRTLQLSYFDHPPLAWWLSRLASLAVGSEAPVVVRLPFIALFAASTWLMFAWTARLFGERAGVWAAVALNLSPVFGVTSATWVLPDGPLIFGLLGVGYCLTRALEDAHGRSLRPYPDQPMHPLAWWGLTGLSAGVALLSKYSAALVLVGAVAYLLTQPAHRRWLGRPPPYVAAGVAILCCLPVVLWNAQHGWASFAFQGGRAATHSFNPAGPVVTLAGEALFLLPWLWLPLMLAWLAALRVKPGRAATWLPACLGALPVVLFALVSLWARNVLFHWAAPGYLMLLPLLGDWAARLEVSRPRLLRIGWQAAVAVVAVGCALLVLENRRNLLAPFRIDPGLAVADWTTLRDQLAQRGLSNEVVATTNWSDTGKLDYALGGGTRVICLNPDARQYRFLPDRALTSGQNVLIIGPDVTMERLAQTYAAEFATVRPLPPLWLRDRDLPMFLASGFRG